MGTAFSLSRNDVRHLTIVAVAVVIVGSAMFASWWTRGYTIESDDPEQSDFPAFIDTLTFGYGPFDVPNYGPLQFDSVRETAVTVTGVAVAMSAILALGSNLVRLGIRTGRIEADYDLPVRLAIASLWTGLFGVLFVLLWPFIGLNGEGYYASSEIFRDESAGGTIIQLVKSQEFLNVGFYLGIIGFVAYPAYLWSDAATLRSVKVGTTSGAKIEGVQA